jgi:transposase InsO family protein
MAWRTTSVEDQRKLFIKIYLETQEPITDLCGQFGISRKTAYKWIDRFKEEGPNGLKDRRRVRHSQLETNQELVDIVLSTKEQKNYWGPKKILGYLVNNYPEKDWPSATTIGNILQRNGYQKAREIRRRMPARTNPFFECLKPNDLWSIDFKGWFQTKEGIKCDPLTLSDAHSRFLLHCSKIPQGTVEYVWDILDKSFYQYGLPKVIRHDNGPPFATCGAGRLSRLSIKIIKAGVIPEWIDPGKPYQNGRHERMHRTLKAEGIFPLELTLKEQQIKFREFQQYFNFERPHESLGQKTPASIYVPSERQWTGKLRSPEYDNDWKVLRVRSSGQISWLGEAIFISKALENENVGVRENEDGDWEVNYGGVNLGVINKDRQLVYPYRETRAKRLYIERVY